jgi:hypothetical protein
MCKSSGKEVEKINSIVTVQPMFIEIINKFFKKFHSCSIGHVQQQQWLIRFLKKFTVIHTALF